jgi:hypothetical protein
MQVDKADSLHIAREIVVDPLPSIHTGNRWDAHWSEDGPALLQDALHSTHKLALIVVEEDGVEPAEGETFPDAIVRALASPGDREVYR